MRIIPIVMFACGALTAFFAWFMWKENPGGFSLESTVVMGATFGAVLYGLPLGVAVWLIQALFIFFTRGRARSHP
jgi:TRAP-type C4-dicarboxylate transport system permease small subunit